MIKDIYRPLEINVWNEAATDGWTDCNLFLVYAFGEGFAVTCSTNHLINVKENGDIICSEGKIGEVRNKEPKP